MQLAVTPYCSASTRDATPARDFSMTTASRSSGLSRLREGPSASFVDCTPGTSV
jgi:hypothetical protein